MSRMTSRKDIYNKIPLSTNDNRDEHILIDVLGNWIPECDVLYYGLLNSKYSDILYKLKNTKMFNPKDTYLDTCYFSEDDMIRYLASENDMLANVSDDFIKDAITTAFDKYSYVPCNETMFRHSIMELSYFNFVKSVTLIYPWDIREIDYQYLKLIIPETVISKFKIVSGTMLGFLESKIHSGIKYTTIVSNSINDINELIDKCDKYSTYETFFLLRNHSKNVKHEIIDDQENEGQKTIAFNEIGNTEILTKLMDFERGVPITKMRFARYEPILFEDAKPNPNEFIFGR